MDPLDGCAVRAHVADLPDPRVARARRHALLDVVAVALCATICGADSWVEVERVGRAKEGWLRTFLDLPNGIPSHDTFGRVFAALDPAAFEAAFLGWVRSLAAATGGAVAIDGKTLRRSHDRAVGAGPLHLVSAWASASGLVLGQVATAEKSNEIAAIPALLDALAPAGRVATIDAMGCQTGIAGAIRARGADYVLALKDNQPTLHDLVAHHFAVVAAKAAGPAPARSYHEDVGKDHGRLEVRRCWATGDPEALAWLDPGRAWPGLRSVAAVEGERRVGGSVSRQTRYDLSSLPAGAAAIGAAVRGHWGIEHRLHWVLDVAFREDDRRVRVGHAAQNLAVLRHLALNLLRRETGVKASIKAKRLMAGWDQGYLLKVLAA